MGLTVLPQGTALDALQPWGSLTALGAEIFEGGDVQAYGKMSHGAPTDPISAGFFGTSKGRYRLVYPFNEQATILTGEVKFTDESTGVTTHLKAGDSWFVTRGTSTVWEIISHGYTKHYLSFV